MCIMKWTGVVFFILMLAAGVFFSKCGGDGDLMDTIATPIAATVEKLKIEDKYYNDRVQLKTRVFYRANENKRAWLKKGRPDKMYKAFVEEVKQSSDFGFRPEDYRIEELTKDVEALYDNRKRTSEDISELDIRITASFFLFTTHLLEGRVRYPGAREFLWEKGMPLENDIALLLEMESGSDLRKKIEALHPANPQYARLQDAFKEYRKMAPADTLPPISESLSVKPQGRDSALLLVRKKLKLLGYNLSPANDPTVLDEELKRTLMEFQEDNGLESDGNLGKQTLQALNVPIGRKIELMALNLERLRWHPRVKREGDVIVVNVPEYILRLYKNEKEKMKMRVILGAGYTPTPIFHDTLKYIVFSPTWTVPQSIFVEEFLPKLVEDPAHFSTERFLFYKKGDPIDPYEEEWDDKELDPTLYRVVENPGEQNSLGKIKFIMPNDHAIYLHDTPADGLFERNARALSHGCIRLEKPEELAEYLLSDQKEWDMHNIKEAMSADEPQQVNLTDPVPVFIVYRTSWVGDNDRVNFRHDIYGHDRRHLNNLPPLTASR